jgi:hypothetical protein
MNLPENSDCSNSLETSLGQDSSRAFEDNLFGELTRTIVRDERRKRRATFQVAKTAIQSAKRLSLELNNMPRSYHTTYVELPDGTSAERNVLFSVMNFPGFGELARLITNDLTSHPTDIDGHQMAIKDDVILLSSNRFSWQENVLYKRRQDSGWTVPSNAGALLEQRSDYVDLVSGSNYDLNIPRPGGWPTPLTVSIIDRLQLERSIEVIESLNVSSHQPGYRLPSVL